MEQNTCLAVSIIYLDLQASIHEDTESEMVKKENIQFLIATLALFGGYFFGISYILVLLTQKLDLSVYTNPLLEIIGWLMVFSGVVVYLVTTQTFFKVAGNTPLITHPTKNVMKVGFYKRTRNPMYIGHLVLLFGIFLITGSPLSLVFWILTAILLHCFIVYYEEPLTKKRLGDKYVQYQKTTPRWI